MPITVPEALEDQERVGAAKAGATASPARYLASSALAGAYVGIGVVLVASTAGPLAAAGSPMTTLVAGCVFGIALTLVVFAGSELFTGNAMVLLQSTAAGRTSLGAVGRVWGLSLVGNLVGSVGFAALVHAGGTLHAGKGAAGTYLATVVGNKSAATGGQLFFRAVLCNMLVCLALWMAARATSDAAKLVVIWWALLAFIASGFEHSIANMTIFSLAALAGDASWADLFRNLVWTVPGNVVGGGLLVGLGYAWIARPSVRTTPTAAGPTTAPAPPVATVVPDAGAATTAA
ncbi:MAG TPA: formate/nitrite transporter family protein [Acidimicrobiales bacterium]